MDKSELIVDGDAEGNGEEFQEPEYDAPRSLDSSDVGRRLSRVAELLKFADAGLRATQNGNQGAQLVICTALCEIKSIMDSNIKVMEVAIPF